MTAEEGERRGLSMWSEKGGGQKASSTAVKQPPTRLTLLPLPLLCSPLLSSSIQWCRSSSGITNLWQKKKLKALQWLPCFGKTPPFFTAAFTPRTPSYISKNLPDTPSPLLDIPRRSDDRPIFRNTPCPHSFFSSVHPSIAHTHTHTCNHFSHLLLCLTWKKQPFLSLDLP